MLTGFWSLDLDQPEASSLAGRTTAPEPSAGASQALAFRGRMKSYILNPEIESEGLAHMLGAPQVLRPALALPLVPVPLVCLLPPPPLRAYPQLLQAETPEANNDGTGTFSL